MKKIITDQDIINLYKFYNESTYSLRKICAFNKDEYKYIINRYNDSECQQESYYRIINHIDIRPKCKMCGGYVHFKNYKVGFNTYCSNKCKCNDIDWKNKRIETYINKYGVDNPNKSKEVRDKLKQTCLERYGVENGGGSKQALEKIKQTNLKKRGVSCVFKDPLIKEKIKQTCLDKYGVTNGGGSKEAQEKIKETCLEKYGVERVTMLDKYKEKVRNTCLIRYGVTNPMLNNEIKNKLSKSYIEKYGCDWIFKSTEIKEKIKNTMISKYGVEHPLQYEEFNEKCQNTKIKNHTWSTSKPEEELYLYIKEKFPLVKRQYKDKIRYPYYCDFYIPELDLFLELNGTWTHGRHAYNSNSIEDQNTLKEWINKYNNGEHPWYKHAIIGWTKNDVKKRNTAKKNNLNFKEVWSLEEGKEYIDKIYIEKNS